MARCALRSLAVAASLAVASCGGSGPAPTPSATPPATAFGAPKGEWTWIDAPGTSCADASPTGFGVNPGDGADVLVFLDGGGACWDYATCFLAALASPGPFGRAQLAARQAAFAHTFFDRADAANPFRAFTYVFIPYCTGDLHAGDADASYSPGAGIAARPWAHHGRRNVAADLQLLAAALPAPPRLVVSGASAGGYGALLGYDAFRAAFPASQGFLVDDSGPPLEGDGFQPALRAAWRSAWHLDALLDPICGTRCHDDLSALVPALAARHPADRMALLSNTQDRVISAFALLPPAAFEAALLVTVHDRYDPLPQARTFLVAGSNHALLAAPASYSAGGVPLSTWIEQMVSGDPAWRSLGP
jgi:hypothetical protein